MKLKDRIKSKLASINLVSVAFFGLSIFSIAFAWFAYTNVVKTNFEVNIKRWKIRITNNNTEVTNNYTFNVSDFYPGMNNFTDSFTIENQGELPAKIDYKIKKLRVFDQTINTDNMTFYELQRDYPFKIDFSYNKRYLAPNDTATFNVSCTWPLESGNDDLDTQYGNMAYDFYQSENQEHQSDPNYQIRSGLELEVEIMVVQYIDETDSFATDSWDTIQINVERGNTSAYQVGDTKSIRMDGDYYTLRIANKSDNYGICHRNDTSLTACGFVVEFENIYRNGHYMNSTATNYGGWPGSELYTYVNGAFFSMLPYDLKKCIATTRVISGYGVMDSSNFTTYDKLYLLSTKEVYGKNSQSTIINDTMDQYTRQLDYYEENNVTTTENTHKAVKRYYNNDQHWWLRTVDRNSLHAFYEVGYNGWPTSNGNSVSMISPAFRIK